MRGGYRSLFLEAPLTAARSVPGQFVHLRVPHLDAALRRPFSIAGADARGIVILYKEVGAGTRAMQRLAAGDAVSLIGPLGNGFVLSPEGVPVLVAGGYGVAPLAFLAERLECRGTVYIGGKGADDILYEERFRERGWNVRVATEDGTAGVRGPVTTALDEGLKDGVPGEGVELFACGPDGLLRAVAERARRLGVRAWLSLDKRMGCGVGACLACVQKVRDSAGRVGWARVCRDGPVFESRRIVWE